MANMILHGYSVYDKKTDAYGRPQFETNEVIATRALTVAANDPQIQLSHFPEDFDLYHVAEFDDHTGIVTPVTPPKYVVSAISLVKLQKALEMADKKEQKNDSSNK